ncbi:uncharacterized protein ASPGLDRAFT_1027681 [Aspergillus glaucus CBS 516.65]|uniref:Uncharacterized protein n=1 Tax=Aspergillus glaucus CBS 516.65 TaxID=1160497 RepID=A0A1L9VW09_ASPGL|nr:hypothetical protein ASPGLDRAFT_1027681 [Aspergillus glaucus CBS 516.65]OJJ88091.1 hypothetical protein ASPGLDRAFT_1027681 [Aspergillus glaucus CBS 516.65]
MTTVWVAIYNPTDKRDPCHWALWLKTSDDQSVILQVGDEKNGRGYYVEDPIYKEPMRSARLAEVIDCGTIPSSKHNQAVLLIQAHPVDNQSTTWNCQAWVIENLENLEQHGLLQVSPTVKASLQAKRQNWQ